MIADDIKLPKKKEPQLRDRVLPPIYDGLSPEMKDKMSSDYDTIVADIESVTGITDIIHGAVDNVRSRHKTTPQNSSLARLKKNGKIVYAK